MFKKEFVSRPVAVLVALLFGLYGVSAGGQSAAPLTLTTAPAAGVAASAEENEAPLKNDASHQGVKVHGHWKIVVKNPDGSVAQTREFENSLVSGFGITIDNFLMGTTAGTGLLINLQTALQSTTNSVCGKANCSLVSSTTLGPGAYWCGSSNTASGTVGCTTGLTANETGSTGTPPFALTLAGQLTATQAGTIGIVGTIYGICPYNTNLSNCPYTASTQVNSFTQTSLSSPVSINSGQIVQVTVTITYS